MCPFLSAMKVLLCMLVLVWLCISQSAKKGEQKAVQRSAAKLILWIVHPILKLGHMAHEMFK